MIMKLIPVRVFISRFVNTADVCVGSSVAISNFIIGFYDASVLKVINDIFFAQFRGWIRAPTPQSTWMKFSGSPLDMLLNAEILAVQSAHSRLQPKLGDPGGITRSCRGPKVFETRENCKDQGKIARTKESFSSR